MPGGRPKVVGIHLFTLPWIPTLGQRTLGVLPATGEDDPGPPVGVVSTRILSPGWAD